MPLSWPLPSIVLPARLLLWYPRAAVSSGLLEAMISHNEGAADGRVQVNYWGRLIQALGIPAPEGLLK